MNQPESRPLAVFLRLASRPIPRVTRMMSVARDLGMDGLFVGAHRAEGLPEQDEWAGVRVQRVGRVFPLVNGARPLVYLSGVFGYWIAALRLLRARRPAMIHASDFEGGVPGVIASRLLGVPVIYNIHDNLGVRYAMPAWARGVLNALEGLVVRASTLTLVPEPFRRDLLPSWSRAKVRVVRNSPDDPGFRPPTAPPSNPPRVLFAGWLDFDRGLAQIVALAGEGRIQLVVAGEGDERVHQLMRETPNVDYRGFCTHEAIMELTAQCDYVAAFYNPTRLINRFAASNKIAEAMAVGRPVLINDELMVAAHITAAGAAIAVPYAEIARLPDVLLRFQSDPNAYLLACQRARALYESEYHETQVRQASVDALREAGVL